MCLIIHKKPEQTLTEAFINDVWNHNKDGWGVISYPNAGEVATIKGLTLDGFKTYAKSIEDREALIHFRMATHGPRTLEMAHPFHITQDIYMMHNGVFRGKEFDAKDKSDTAIFADIVRDCLGMTSDPNTFVRSDKFFNLIQPDLQGQSVVFADSKGIIPMGIYALDCKTTDGLIVSNEYAYTVNNPNSNKWSNDWRPQVAVSRSWEQVERWIQNLPDMDMEEIFDEVIEDPSFIVDVLCLLGDSLPKSKKDKLKKVG